MSRLIQGDIGNPNILGGDEADEIRPALVAIAGARLIPAHHHVLPLVELLHKLQPLPVHRASAADPDVARVLRHHRVPPRRLRRIVLDPRPGEHGGAGLNVQHHARSQPDRGGQVGSGRECDVAAGGGGAPVDGRLDCGRVVVDAVANGSEVGDGEVGRSAGKLKWDWAEGLDWKNDEKEEEQNRHWELNHLSFFLLPFCRLWNLLIEIYQ